MPFSVVKKFPEVISDLARAGYKKEVSFTILRLSIIRVIGIVKDDTIKNTSRIMEDLGYIKRKEIEGLIPVFKICQGEPYKFDTIGDTPARDADDLLDKMTGATA